MGLKKAKLTNMLPIIFLLGLSGAGKSTLANFISTTYNFKLIDFDNSGDVDAGSLLEAWHKYTNEAETEMLSSSVKALINAGDFSGAVLTFSSIVSPSAQQIQLAGGAGMRTAILSGTPEECLRSYLDREMLLDRGFDAKRWHKFNDHSAAKFARVEYEPYLVKTFDGGKHVSLSNIVKAIRQKNYF